MVNKDYKTIQILSESYEFLKAHCDKHGLKMGKFVSNLIDEKCKPKLPTKNVLRVIEQ